MHVYVRMQLGMSLCLSSSLPAYKLSESHACMLPERVLRKRAFTCSSQGVRDMVKRWLMSFCEIGELMKRLDVGEGNYTKELEEDYDVYDAMNQVRERVCVCMRERGRVSAHSTGLIVHAGGAWPASM